MMMRRTTAKMMGKTRRTMVRDTSVCRTNRCIVFVAHFFLHNPLLYVRYLLMQARRRRRRRQSLKLVSIMLEAPYYWGTVRSSHPSLSLFFAAPAPPKKRK